MKWSKAASRLGAVAAAASHHGWLAAAVILGPLALMGLICAVLVVMVPADKRSEAVSALVPALIAAVTRQARSAPGGAPPKKKALRPRK